MVYLKTIIEKLKQGIDPQKLDYLAYCFIRNTPKLASFTNEFTGQDLVAAKGYLGVELTPNEVTQLSKKGYKGVDYSSTIFKFVGATLASSGSFTEKIKEKFSKTNFKNKYFISRCIPSLLPVYLEEIKADQTQDSLILKFIDGIEQSEETIARAISTHVEQASGIIDLLILEELHEKLIKFDLDNILYNGRSGKDNVIKILENFHNAAKKITGSRRKGHPSFNLHDEYDVQDMLYVILKSVYPTLREEDPTPKVGRKSNKIDLIIRELGVLIEVKMLKKEDSTEKEYIEQLKNDIQSYHQCQWLKYLIFFVYDPYHITGDVNSFYDLKGYQTINQSSFEIEVVVAPK